MIFTRAFSYCLYPSVINLKCMNLLQENFSKCVKGYHLVNNSPINEGIWEDLNSIIFVKSGIDVFTKSNGCHLSGMDIHTSIGKISNKTAKYKKNKTGFDVSSYRLTKVCGGGGNEKNGGSKEFIEEINKRKNFDYYSLIVRDETTNKIQYDWYMIPSDDDTFNPQKYEWEPIIGKKGKKINEQLGWKTNEINGSKMTITFSMSSQLWIHILGNKQDVPNIKQYIIANTIVDKNNTYDYIDLYNNYVPQ